MPANHTLDNGNLQLNGKGLLCPFATRVVVPAPYKTQGQTFLVKSPLCGSWCPLFMDLPANIVDNCKLSHRVRLFCSQSPVEFEIADQAEA